MRVVVIGGGVIGLCSAYSLAKRGMDVVVVDPEEGISTSTINAGMIVPSHIIPLAAPGMVQVGMKMILRPKSPFWIRPRLDKGLINWGIKFAKSCTQEHVDRSKKLLLDLNSASKQAYLEFERELEGFHVEQKGLLMIARKESSLEEESHVAAQVREMGLPVDILNARDIATVDPGIKIDAVGGVHYLADCHFSPPKFMAALRRRLYELGVTIKKSTVVDFDPGNGEAVTTDENLEADQFVLAAGAWSGLMARQLGLNLPMQAGKGYSFDIENPLRRPSICAILMEARVAVTPMENAVRFGGTMEIGEANALIDERRVDGIREAVPDYYPDFRGVNLKRPETNVGLRPCSPDGLPYIGRLERFDNVVVATGHAMMGMSLGPITGRLVAEIIADEEPSIRIEALKPERFA